MTRTLKSIGMSVAAACVADPVPRDGQHLVPPQSGESVDFPATLGSIEVQAVSDPRLKAVPLATKRCGIGSGVIGFRS